MSFMSDFGDSFSKSFDSAFDKSTDNYNDNIKLQMKNALEQQKEYKKQQQEDKKNVSTAKSIAQQYNAPVGPLLEMLRAGVDPSRVESQAKNGSWSKSGSASQGSQKAADSDSSASTVDNPFDDSNASTGGYKPNPKVETLQQRKDRLTQLAANGDENAKQELQKLGEASRIGDPSKVETLDQKKDRLRGLAANGDQSAIDELKRLGEVSDLGNAPKIETLQQKKDRLVQAAANGDENAKKELQNLGEAGRIGDPSKAETFEQKKNRLIEAAANGDESAKEELKRLGDASRLGDAPKEETLQQRKDRLTQAAANGDQNAAEELKKYNQAAANSMPQSYDQQVAAAKADVAAGKPGATDRLTRLTQAGQVGQPQDYNKTLGDARVRAANGDPEAQAYVKRLESVGPQPPVMSDAGLISKIVTLKNSPNPEDVKEGNELEQSMRKQNILKAQMDGKFGNAKMAMVISPDQSQARLAMVKQVTDSNGNIINVDAATNKPIDGQPFNYTEDMQKIDAQITQNQTAKPVVDYKERQRNAVGAVRDGNELIRLAAINPNIIAAKVGGAADVINTVLKEINAGVDEFLKPDGVRDKALSSDQIIDLQNKVNSIEPSSLKTFADQVAYFNAKKILFAYNAGQALGQAGRNFTQTDYENVMQATDVRTSDAAYADNMQSYLRNMIEKVNDSYDNVKGFNNPINQMTELNEAVGKRYQPVVQTMDDYVSGLNDPRLKNDYQASKNSTSTTFAPRPVNQPNSQTQIQQTAIPQGAIDYLKQHPELAGQFDAKYGNGQNISKQYLGN